MKRYFILISVFLLSLKGFSQWTWASEKIPSFEMFSEVDYFDSVNIVSIVTILDANDDWVDRVAISSNFCSSWDKVTSLYDEKNLGALTCVKNSNTAYVLSKNKLYKSTDKGSKWDSVSYSCPTQNPRPAFINLKFVSETEGYALSDFENSINGSNVYATSDGGNTWNVLFTQHLSYSGQNEQKKIVTKTKNNVLIIANYDSLCFYNVTTKNLTVKVVPNHIRDIAFVNDKHGFILSSGDVLVETKDGGDTWTDVKLAKFYVQAFGLQRISFCDENTGILVSDDIQYYITYDGGKRWIQIERELDYKNLQFVSLKMINKKTVMGIGNSNFHMMITDKLDTAAKVSTPSAIINSNNSSAKVSVNNGKLHCSLDNNSDNLEISIYSIDGKAIYKNSTKNYIENSSLIIDLPSMNQGIYLVNIKSDIKSETRKIIIQ